MASPLAPGPRARRSPAASAISSRPVCARSRVIHSAASWPSAAKVVSPVRLSNAAITARFGWSSAPACRRAPATTPTAARPTAAATPTGHARRRGRRREGDGGGVVALGETVSPRGIGAPAAWRARTASIWALVSGAGSTLKSASSRRSNSSYSWAAPARSPSRSSSSSVRRTSCSSWGASSSARRNAAAASARSPADSSSSARRRAPVAAAARSRARSWSSHRSNSGAPEMKNPASRSPR